MLNAGVIEAILRLRDQFTPVLARAQAQLATTAAKMTATGARLTAIGTAARTAGLAITTGFSLPLAAISILAVKTFAEFEKGMNRVLAVTGATDAGFQELTNTAEELGRTTVFTARQAADAMGFLGLAGFKTNEIIGAMPDVLNLAAAGQLEVAEAADIAAKVMRGFGLEVDQLGPATDVLTKAFTIANTNLSQLGQAFKFAGPVARAAGISFNQTVGALALMADAGFQATLGGTALRGAMVRLLNPSAAMQKAMNKIGLSSKDATGKLLPLDEIIRQLEPHAEDAGLIMELFGLRAGPAMASLIARGADALVDFTRKLDNAGGTAARIAEIQLRGLAGQWILLKSAIEGVGISLGRELAPAFTSLLQTLRTFSLFLTESVIPAFANLPAGIQKAILAIGALIIIGGPLVALFGLLVSGIGAAFTALGSLLVVLPKVIGRLFGVTTATTASTVATNVLTASFWRLSVSAAASQAAIAIKTAVVATLTGVLRVAVFATKALWVTMLAHPVVAVAAAIGALTLATVKWISSAKEAELAAATLGAQQDVINKAIKAGSNETISYANAIKFNEERDIARLAAIKGSVQWLEKLSKTLDTAIATETSFSSALQNSGAVMDNLTLAVRTLASTGELTPVWMEKIGAAADRIQKSGRELTPELQNIVNALAQMKAKATDAADGLEGLSEAAQKLFDKLTDAGLKGEVVALEAAFAALQARGGVTALELLRIGQEASGLQARGHELSGALEQTAARFDVLTGSGVESADAMRQAKAEWQGVPPIFDAMGKQIQIFLPFLGGIEAIALTGAAAMAEFLRVTSGMPAAFEPGISTFRSFKEAAESAFGNLPNVILAAVTGGGDVMRSIGTSMGGQLGESLTAGATKLMSGVFGEKIGGALGGLMGPLGALLGGLLGKGLAKVMSLFGSKPVFKQIMDDIGKTWGIAISESLAKEIEKLATQVGDRVLAQVLSLSKIITEAGGVMAFGFQLAANKAKDLFSLIEQGKTTLDEIRPTFIAVFTELVQNLGNADAAGKIAFDNLVSAAIRFGISMEDLGAIFLDNIDGMIANIDVFAEGGVEAFQRIIDQGLALGLSMEELGPVFAAALAPAEAAVRGIITAAIQAGGIVSEQFMQMIASAQELGIANEEIAAFFASNWTKATEGMVAVLASGIELSKGTLQSFADAAFAAFSAAVAAGTPLITALKNMQPLWDDLKKRMIEAGLQGSTAFRQMNSWMRLATGETGELVSGILAMGQVMEGLANTGALTQRVFNRFGRDVVSSFDKMRAGGVSQRRALIAIQPTLQSLWEAQQRFGFKVDESTQKLIDEAEAAGIVGEEFTSSADKQVAALDRVVELLEDLVALLSTGIADAAESGSRAVESSLNSIDPDPIVVQITYDDPGFDDSPREGGGGDSGNEFAHGALVRRPTIGRIGEGGQPEIVGPVSFMAQALAGAITQRGGGVGSGGSTKEIIRLVTVDGAVLAEVVVPYLPEALQREGLDL
jgi:TP901 family phage tail tape measure protein